MVGLSSLTFPLFPGRIFRQPPYMLLSLSSFLSGRCTVCNTKTRYSLVTLYIVSEGDGHSFGDSCVTENIVWLHNFGSRCNHNLHTFITGRQNYRDWIFLAVCVSPQLWSTLSLCASRNAKDEGHLRAITASAILVRTSYCTELNAIY